MSSLQSAIREYKSLLRSSMLSRAYRGILGFMMSLRTQFSHDHPQWVIGSLYQGMMDISFFSITTQQLQEKKLKIALVFHHPETRFELWLCGRNKQIQSKYLNLLAHVPLGKYHLSTPDTDAILTSVILTSPDFDHPETLTSQIEKSTVDFIRDMQPFISD